MLTLNTVGKGMGYFDAAISELRNIHVLKIGKLPGDKALVRMGCKKPRLGLNVATPREIFSFNSAR